MSYKIVLNQFEGPFDLLVYLIENARMSIYDIRISEITAQYLRYVDEMKKMDVMVAAEFMVLAATLIDIKSKMLLPRSTPENAGTEYEDPRTELVQKLLEYKRYKGASEMLAAREESGFRTYEKPKEDLALYTGEPDELLKLDIRQFVKAFEEFIVKRRKVDEIRKRYEQDQRHRMTTETRMLLIRDLIAKDPNREYPFYELIPNRQSSYDTALSFVSLLEMLKQRQVTARQKSLFGEISVKATENLMHPSEADQEDQEVPSHDQ